ncbi:MAG TPA: DNA-3-methyladenine glycosylase [Pelobium sp.]|nr:DNA-3-methyladenine glycosylase [Pelobium sp.]
MERFSKDFYQQHGTIALAQLLLGCELVHETVDGVTAGIIVETEAYLRDDPGSHAFKKETPRNRAMFGMAGTLYVYQIYNHYNCVNVVAEPEGVGEAVLIRALQPTQGIELMAFRRNEAFKTGFARFRNNSIDPTTTIGHRNLCNGPAKLTIAMGIGKEAHNGSSLVEGDIYIRGPVMKDFEMMTTTRIGLSQGTDLPYRYYIKGNSFVSKK